MSLSEEQIALYARQILVIGGIGQEKLCAAKARVAKGSLVARWLEAGGTAIDDAGDPPCAQCQSELGDSALVALTFQQRVLTGRCPRHP